MFSQLLTSGLCNGSLYALIAFGFVVIFNVTGWLNFPQGQYMFIGAFFTITFLSLGVPMILAVFLGIFVTVCIGILFARLTLHRMRQPGFAAAVLIMSGACFLYDGIMMVSFGKYPKTLPPFSERFGIEFIGVNVSTQSLWMIGITVVLGLALWYFFSRTLYGKAMRATAQNSVASRLVGIDTKMMVSLSVALSSGIGAIGGIVIAPLTYVVYDGGIPFTMKGFVSAVIGGGLVSYSGAFLGGLVVGVGESLITGYVTSLFKDVVLFCFLILMLVWRPTGILGPR